MLSLTNNLVVVPEGETIQADDLILSSGAALHIDGCRIELTKDERGNRFVRVSQREPATEARP